jgi:hypothetical protein
METILSEAEVRILGCLIEKEMTTPDHYPLSLNALINACNQKSNRNPVTVFDEAMVEKGLDSLQVKGFTQVTHAAGSRVPKYLHTFLDKFDLSGQELAVLCELMLRGPQTMGELRAHVERISAIENLETVDRILQTLTDQAPSLVVRLEREPGRKERRYMHLLSGEPVSGHTESSHPSEEKLLNAYAASNRISKLEEELRLVREELEGIKKLFAEFKALR